MSGVMWAAMSAAASSTDVDSMAVARESPGSSLGGAGASTLTGGSVRYPSKTPFDVGGHADPVNISGLAHYAWMFDWLERLYHSCVAGAELLFSRHLDLLPGPLPPAATVASLVSLIDGFLQKCDAGTQFLVVVDSNVSEDYLYVLLALCADVDQSRG
jgi:hypothetical protein